VLARLTPAAPLSLVLLGLWLIAQPSSAFAWTRAQIRGADAHVEVIDASTAQIALTLKLHISGGWLSELELPGLAADIVPDADKPPTVIAETGEKYAPELAFARGMWRVTFVDKRSAPWRGDYTLTLFYRESLTTEQLESGLQRLRWSMPPWRLGMEEPRIWISAPVGSRPSVNGDSGAFGAERVLHLRGRSLISHTRAQLPRDTEWSVAVDVPFATRDVSTSGPPSLIAPRSLSIKNAAAQSSQWLPASLWLPSWILCLALLKRRLVHGVAQRQRYVVRPLVPLMHARLRTPIIIALSALAALLWSRHAPMSVAPLGIVVLLAIDRSFDRPPALTLRWSTASRAQLEPTFRSRLRSWIAPAAWMDVTMPIGALCVGCAYAVMLLAGRLDARQTHALTVLALLIAPLWTTSTRLHMPWDGARIGRTLTRWLQRNRTALEGPLAEAVEPLLSWDENETARDARLPLRIARGVTGLSGLDLTLVTDARSLRRRVALLAQTIEGSAADLTLAQLPMSARRAASGRAYYVFPAEHVLTAINALDAAAHDDAVPTTELDRAAA